MQTVNNLLDVTHQLDMQVFSRIGELKRLTRYCLLLLRSGACLGSAVWEWLHLKSCC